MSLPTLLSSVQKLQTALQAKAKAEPSYRFYSLWDKVYREDVLWEAYQRCRANCSNNILDLLFASRLDNRNKNTTT